MAVYNPQNDGFWFTKQRVYFLRGAHPSFFVLCSESDPESEFAPGSESVLLFVLSRRFCFPLVLVAFFLVFPLFCGWTLLFLDFVWWF